MRVLVHQANLGGFDEIALPVAQLNVEMTYKVFTDADFPPRPRAMSRRLQARIPKMFGWDLCPEFDAYLWVDASLQLHRPDSVHWFVEQLADHTIAVFKHPWRSSAAEEAEFLRVKLKAGSRYICTRYEGEDLEGQMRALPRSPWYQDDRFYASGAFIYRPGARMERATKEWWIHTSRFHCIDQLSFPYALAYAGCDVHVIDEDIYHASHLKFTRRHGHG